VNVYKGSPLESRRLSGRQVVEEVFTKRQTGRTRRQVKNTEKSVLKVS
jgi:hypothetical protein